MRKFATEKISAVLHFPLKEHRVVVAIAFLNEETFSGAIRDRPCALARCAAEDYLAAGALPIWMVTKALEKGC